MSFHGCNQWFVLFGLDRENEMTTWPTFLSNPVSPVELGSFHKENFVPLLAQKLVSVPFQLGQYCTFWAFKIECI